MYLTVKIFKKLFGTTLLTLLLLPSVILGQVQFQKLYARTDTVGQSIIEGISQTSDGGYIMCGEIYPCFNCLLGDGIVIKTDAYGDTLWTKKVGGPRNDGFGKILQTKDGNYLCAGTTTSWGQQATSQLYGDYVYLVKLDVNGDTLWTKIYGGTNTDVNHWNTLWDIEATSDSGFIMSLQVIPPNNPYDILIIKTNSQGDTLWTRSYATMSGEAIIKIQQTLDKGYILAGQEGGDALLMKIDSLGNIQWQRTFGGGSTDVFRGVETTITGDYIVSGYSSSFTSNTNVNYIYTMRLNSIGDTIWSKVYGPVFTQRFLNKFNDTTYFITGLSGSSNGGILAMKVDGKTGNILFQKEYGSSGSVNGVGMVSDDGFIFCTGTGGFGASYQEGYVIKADANGNSGCYEYTIAETILPAPTIVQNATLQEIHFPIYIEGTQTQVSSGCKIGTVCFNAGIQNEISTNSHIIYPNPTSDVLNIEIHMQDAEIKIYDMLGNELLNEKLNYKKQIDISSFTKGVYFLVLRSNEKIYTSKLVKE